MSRRGVLLMAYGTPRDLDDVEAYYTDIRGGRKPPPELLEELRERYRAIGGKSPLLEITRAQAQDLERKLDGVRVYVGQKHAAPTIPDAVRRMKEDGVDEAVGVVLAPHYSTMSVGDYERRARAAAADVGWQGALLMVRNWHLEPGYVDLLVQRIVEATGDLPDDARREPLLVFTAHSLPQRILASGDPYPQQLEETAAAVARRVHHGRLRVGWQSAGRTREPWLGPDVLDIIREEAEAGTQGVIVCPCGFVADHLEVLYDLDIEAQRVAGSVGLALTRTRSPNADPAFITVLAAVVEKAIRHEAA